MLRLGILACGLLVACGDNLEVFEDPPSIEVAHYAAVQTSKIDVLFVVDNTMPAATQRDMGHQIGPLFDAIAALPGQPSVHVGVTTTDLGSTTSLARSTPEPAFDLCDGVGRDGVLATVPEGTPDLAAALYPLLQVGSQGCDFEQPLGAMARALDNPANAGFVRDDANLLVVLASNEDDCSIRDAAMFDPTSSAELGERLSFRCTRFGVTCDEPIRTVGMKAHCRSNETSRLVEHVGTYVERLRSARPDPTRVAAYAMSGPTTPVVVDARGSQYVLEPSCSYTAGSLVRHSVPGIRLQQFTSAFGANGGYGEVCQSNFVGQALDMAALVNRMAGVTCLDTAKLIDSGSQPGIQPSCSVTVEEPAGDRVLHDCADDMGGDCFQVLRDVDACPAGDSLRLDVQLASPSPDAHVRASCFVPL